MRRGRAPQGKVRRMAVLVHRYVGLVMAGFLLLAGQTGALLVWYHELDAFINRDVMRVRVPVQGVPQDPLQLRSRVQASFPHALVHVVPLHRGAPDEAVSFRLRWPVKELATHRHDEVFVNPYTGEVLGGRKWGDITQGLTNLMPFIYRLHYSLAMATVGTWVFGIVALLWTIDCFVGAWLTMPAAPRSGRAPVKSWWARWAPAWTLRWRSGATKLNFDLHRAGGLWPWAMLFVLAWSSVAFNLYEPVYRPLMGSVFDFQPDPRRSAVRLDEPLAEPPMGWVDMLQAAREHARAQAAHRGFTLIREDSLNFDAARGLARLRVMSSLDVSQIRGRTELYVSARDGALLAVRLPTGAGSGDTVTNWLLSLHMGHVWGLPYRVFLTLLAVAVAMLSVTGVIIWWKKRRGRSSRPQRPHGQLVLQRQGEHGQVMRPVPAGPDPIAAPATRLGWHAGLHCRAPHPAAANAQHSNGHPPRPSRWPTEP